MAYYVKSIFYKIPLYSLGREQERKSQDLLQSAVGFPGQRYMAWGRMEFYLMGAFARRAVCPDEDVAGKKGKSGVKGNG